MISKWELGEILVYVATKKELLIQDYQEHWR